MKRTLRLSPLLLPVLMLSHDEAAVRSRLLVLAQVTVIDATGAPPKPKMSVLIAANRIVAVGRTGEVRIPQDADIVNAKGKFLIPGLWDMPTKQQTFLQLFEGTVPARFQRLLHSR